MTDFTDLENNRVHEILASQRPPDSNMERHARLALSHTHPLQLQITDGAEPQRWWNIETTAKCAPLTRRLTGACPAWAEALSSSSEQNERWVCVSDCLDPKFCLSGNVSLKSLLLSKHILLFMSALQKHMLLIQWYIAKNKTGLLYYTGIIVVIIIIFCFIIILSSVKH